MALTAKKVYAILKRQISDMEAKLNSPVRYRGTVATADLLPLNPDIGDMYNIESKSIYGEAGMNVAWNGVVWDTMGAPIDMSLYIKSSELADWAKQPQKPDYTAEEVGALPANTKIPSKTSDLQNDSGFLTKIPDNYLSGTDKTLSASGKAADAKATGDKITELSADISNKLNKNQGSENSGKIAGINESGDIVPMFPVSVDYNEETNCLEFGSDQKMELNKGINLDSTLTKTGYAADAGAVGEITNSLKKDIAHRAIVNGGKNLVGNEANRLYAVGYIPAGTKLTVSMKDGGLLTGANLLIYNSDKIQVSYWNMWNNNKKRTFETDVDVYYVAFSSVVPDRPMQLEIGDTATDFEDYVPNVVESMNLAEIEYEKIRELNKVSLDIASAAKTGIAQSLAFSSFGYYRSGNLKKNLGDIGEKISADYYNIGEAGSSSIQSLFGRLQKPITYSDTKTLYVLITSSISGRITLHASYGPNWAPVSNPLVGDIILKKGTNFYKISLNKQYADEYYKSPKDFYYILFQATSVSPFENFIFDAYVFDNSNLYDILTPFDLSEYYTKNEIDSLMEASDCDYKIIFWGDSLTAGAGGNGTTYPKVCADELGITNYLNAGVGGETANTIACRNGADSMIVPAGDVNGTYSIGELKDAYGTNILPLRQGTGGNTVNPIVINGHECTLSLSQTSATDANAIYTISGYTGELTKYPMPCKFSGCDLTSDITVIFVGQNGPSFDQRLSIIDSIVSRTNGKYVVLTLSSGTEEQMKSQETTMLSKYGNHLFKTREMLAKYGMAMMNMSPTDEDITAISNGSVPPSLRIDSVHLNASGYTILGKMLAAHIRALGYVD